MQTQFVSLSLPWQPNLDRLVRSIEAALRQQGEPLRWAIAAREGSMVRIEAVVTPCSGDR